VPVPGSGAGVDFRALCDALAGARLERLELDALAARAELVARTDAGTVRVEFAEVAVARWSAAAHAPSPGAPLEVVGLERLAPGEPWRAHLAPHARAELEITAARLSCDGAEVTGVGRRWRDGRARGPG
jgi:hypothetical protein